MNYPVYRKYLNELSWFKITGPDSFEEIRRMGTRYLKTTHAVKILPDRNLLHDLLVDYHSFAMEIDAAEYDSVELRTQQNG